jgi:hypothetical protein
MRQLPPASYRRQLLALSTSEVTMASELKPAPLRSIRFDSAMHDGRDA